MNQDDTQVTSIHLFTIGFTGKSAQEFFDALRAAGVKKIVDVRLNNVSQLAGFTKKRDLKYFLRVIGNIDYAHEVSLSPTKDVLTAYKKKLIDWAEYERCFDAILQERQPTRHMSPEQLDFACLLCSELEHQHCHRRLVAEHFQAAWRNVEIRHL